MVKLNVHKAEVKCKVDGPRIELMAELTLGVAHVLKGILSQCPDNKFKETLIKNFFENILFSIKFLEGDINEQC